MSITVYTKTYDAPALDLREILRYAGIKNDAGASDEIFMMLRSCIGEIAGKLTYKVCYCELPVRQIGSDVEFSFARIHSASLAKNLTGCESVILFSATVGSQLDRAIAKYSSVSPTKALLLQAIGAERIESLCEAFCSDIKKEKRAQGYQMRPRFSAGYGDVALSLQKDIFAVLDCHKRIGLTLNESMLMSPSKSVTAFIGISANKE
ncbi:MAG: Vitamin B12 dependent methionine synthase activation subunit [Ruminococcaceae bacterium]|nr:Vitamin B12 dependent methionine synthase activation subunit [Oscillospiraceae bacterium]